MLYVESQALLDLTRLFILQCSTEVYYTGECNELVDKINLIY